MPTVQSPLYNEALSLSEILEKEKAAAHDVHWTLILALREVRIAETEEERERALAALKRVAEGIAMDRAFAEQAEKDLLSVLLSAFKLMVEALQIAHASGANVSSLARRMDAILDRAKTVALAWSARK